MTRMGQRSCEIGHRLEHAYSPPREEGWLRHQENFGEAHLSAAGGGGAHTQKFSCGGPPRPPHQRRLRGILFISPSPPLTRGGITALHQLIIRLQLHRLLLQSCYYPRVSGKTGFKWTVALILFGVLFLGVSDTQVVAPLLPLIAQDMGTTPGHAGMIVTTYSLAAAAFALFA